MASTKPENRPVNAYRIPAMFRNLSYKLSSALSSSTTSLDVPTPRTDGSFSKATRTDHLFPTTNPTVDGDECLHDCASCSVKYPRKFDIDETEELYGHVKGWSTHLIVATGKTDWVRDVADEQGSIMEAVGKGAVQPSNGKLMLSASDMPIPDHSDHSSRVLLLPSWQFIDHVTPKNTPDLINTFVNSSSTNLMPLSAPTASKQPSPSPTPPEESLADPPLPESTTSIPPTLSSIPPLSARPCPHKYLILMCSQKTRDARCGQSAPLLRREFERILRPMGLYRDLHDERPGGVGIYFISHVGGHKFSANVMIYRHSSVIKRGPVANGHTANGGAGLESLQEKINVEDANGRQIMLDADQEHEAGEAAQCIWLARVRPEDCENIIRYTVLQGKVVKPERQLRGGFDRSKQIASW